LGNFQIVGESQFADTEDPNIETHSHSDNRSYKSRGIFSTQSMNLHPLKFGASLKTINFEALNEERSEHSSQGEQIDDDKLET
jgi:hypothetical protein